MRKYHLLVKTGEAEIRALEQLTKEDLGLITPIIELTRGRRSKYDKEGDFTRKLSTFSKLFFKNEVYFDLTSELSLLNTKLISYYSPIDGYLNWINFVLELKSKGAFHSIIPSILVNNEDEDLENNLQNQVNKLISNFGSCFYRLSIDGESWLEDLEIIRKGIDDEEAAKVILLVDLKYINSSQNVVERVLFRIQKFKELFGESAQTILSATSFPNSVSDITSEDSEVVQMYEEDLFFTIKLKYKHLIYSDYGSINPIRNDEVIMRRGWIPRIDVSLRNAFLFHRIKKDRFGSYDLTYVSVARKIIEDNNFPSDLNCWGIRVIKEAADGNCLGASPSFWISVRMNTHINQVLNKLFQYS